MGLPTTSWLAECGPPRYIETVCCQGDEDRVDTGIGPNVGFDGKSSLIYMLFCGFNFKLIYGQSDRYRQVWTPEWD